MNFESICEALRAAEIEDYKFEARVLLEEFCGSVSEFEEYESEELEAAIKKRCQRYPLQYIIGKWEFYGYEFLVNENCLIPRADTETVIEVAKKLLPKEKNLKIADLCAGSGCIGITLLRERQNIVCDAVELYEKTLDIAKENAKINGVSDRYNPILADVLSGDCISGKYSAIISNPPYIRQEVLDTLSDEVKREPMAALDGGQDGLVFYRAILDMYVENLEADGKFIFEIGYDQGQSLRELASARQMECEIICDLGGRDRVAVISRKALA